MSGWSVQGFLPPFDPADEIATPEGLTPEHLCYLVEDIAMYQKGNYTVDIGWFPELDPQGGFVCKLIIGDHWDKPIERFETKSLDKTISWLIQACSYIEAKERR